jgi:hypothetical protein
MRQRTCIGAKAPDGSADVEDHGSGQTPFTGFLLCLGTLPNLDRKLRLRVNGSTEHGRSLSASYSGRETRPAQAM